jgi:hypothetical protein
MVEKKAPTSRGKRVIALPEIMQEKKILPAKKYFGL